MKTTCKMLMLQITCITLSSLVVAIDSKHYQVPKPMSKKMEQDQESEVRDYPCPDENLFLPCVCSSDVNYKMSADCSGAQSDDDLAQAFRVTQSFYTYKSLTIKQTTPSDLNTFTKDTFGGVGFETIEITGTNLRVIEDGTFASSEESLTTLDLSNNAIYDFPFESLPQYVALKSLNLKSNAIEIVRDLESDSLVTLNLNENGNLNISYGLFRTASNLENLYLRGCEIEELTTDMLLPLNSIKNIDLSNNLITQLEDNAFNYPEQTLESLNLSDNPLSVMAAGAFDNDLLIADTTKLSFVNTKFVELCETVWGEIVPHLGEGSINLAENPLRCGCDMAWLFDGTSLNKNLDPATACSDGSPVQNLDPGVFEAHCNSITDGMCPVLEEQNNKE